MFDLPGTASAAFALYEAVRHRLPNACFPAASLHLPGLLAVADHCDGFLLDAFGVLNVGETAIPGALASMAALRARGKRLCVLTNAASYTRAGILAKYHRLGFDFTAAEVVSSRDVAVAGMTALAPGAHWAAIASAEDDFHDMPARLTDALGDPSTFDSADAFVFLSSVRWTETLQDRLLNTLARNPRLVVIANPDIVAPREADLSMEPGLYAHRILDALNVPVHWFGKPFPEAFTEALVRLDLEPNRVVMVGDTLHTDTLGGAAAGCGTVLITDHGLFRGHDTAPFIAASGIRPGYIIPTP